MGGRARLSTSLHIKKDIIMAAYIVATVNVTDPVKFGGYVQAIAGLSEKHGGEYIVRGKVTKVLEGDINPEERVVVVRFATEEAAIGYAQSPEYKAGKALRVGAGTVDTRLIVVAD
jgi:uncharacterized protein (DUF1330 family)